MGRSANGLAAPELKGLPCRAKLEQMFRRHSAPSRERRFMTCTLMIRSYSDTFRWRFCRLASGIFSVGSPLTDGRIRDLVMSRSFGSFTSQLKIYNGAFL